MRRNVSRCAWTVMVCVGVIAAASPGRAAQADPQPSGSQREVWVARYDGPGTSFGPAADRAHDVVFAPDGQTVYVSGSSYAAIPGLLSPDYATAAYDAETGRQLWLARYDGPVGGSDDQTALAVTPDGSKVFITGISTGKGTGSDFATIAYDAKTGEQLWLARYDGPASESDWGSALSVSPDGSTIFVIGLSHTAGGPDYGIVAYDTQSGDQLWVAHYDGPGHGTDDPRAVDVSPDGSIVVVTGQSSGADSFADWGTVAFDAHTGDLLWNVDYDGPSGGIDVGDAVTTTSAGTVVVTGSTRTENRGANWLTISYSLETGEELWRQSYDGGGETDVPRAIRLTPDGGSVVVTGNSWGKGTDSDYTTISYDAATGEPVWSARYNGSASGLDIARDVTITPDGEYAIVTGQSVDSETGNDYVTIAYDAATGERVWTGSYDYAGSQDRADAVALHPLSDGGVLVAVTGESAERQGRDVNVDYATVVYRTPWVCNVSSVSSVKNCRDDS